MYCFLAIHVAFETDPNSRYVRLEVSTRTDLDLLKTVWDIESRSKGLGMLFFVDVEGEPQANTLTKDLWLLLTHGSSFKLTTRYMR